MPDIIAIVPKLALTGGNLEVERLVRDLQKNGRTVDVIPIYSKRTNPFLALIGAPLFTLIVISKLLRQHVDLLILTHYSTLPFALLKPLLNCKISFFVQDFEWLFISKSTFVQNIAKSLHFFIFLFADSFIFGNHYLQNNFPLPSWYLRARRMRPKCYLYPVGSYPLSSPVLCCELERDFKIGFILRNGWLKNQSMYYSVFSLLISEGIIAPSSVSAVNMLNSADIAMKFRDLGINLINPMPSPEISDWMSSLDFFLCLSVHEGFGLPPLEAMCYGAVPIVLMNGGCMVYLHQFPDLIIPSESMPVDIAKVIAKLLAASPNSLVILRERLSRDALSYLSWAEATRSVSSSLMVSSYNCFI